jgi:hypothetical protein
VQDESGGSRGDPTKPKKKKDRERRTSKDKKKSVDPYAQYLFVSKLKRDVQSLVNEVLESACRVGIPMDLGRELIKVNDEYVLLKSPKALRRTTTKWDKHVTLSHPATDMLSMNDEKVQDGEKKE